MLQSRSFVKKTKKGKVLKVGHTKQLAHCRRALLAARTDATTSNMRQQTSQAWPHTDACCMLPPPATHQPPADQPRCEPWQQVVREHYLRDDIYSGTPLDPECPPEAYKLSGDAPHYLLVDTNVVLHQVRQPSSLHSPQPAWDEWQDGIRRCSQAAASPDCTGQPPYLVLLPAPYLVWSSPAQHTHPHAHTTTACRWTFWSTPPSATWL